MLCCWIRTCVYRLGDVCKNHLEESSRMPTAIIFLSNEMQFSFDNFYTSSPACICLQICIHKAFCPILFYDFIRVYTLFYGAPCIHSYSSHPVTQSPNRLTLPDKTHMLEITYRGRGMINGKWNRCIHLNFIDEDIA